jgi:hypothetical protein
MKDQYGKGDQPEPNAFEELGLDKVELPEWFEYPKAFKHVVRLELVDWSRGSLSTARACRSACRGLRAGIRCVTSFPRRGDNDDIACWERGPR